MPALCKPISATSALSAVRHRPAIGAAGITGLPIDAPLVDPIVAYERALTAADALADRRFALAEG